MHVRIAAALLLGLGIAAWPDSAHAALVISKAPTQNMSCAGGVCNATAPDAVLNAKDLANMLAASNVEVFAEVVATEITVSAPFSWVSTNRLTLGAYGSLNVKDAITVAGSGNLTIATNVAGTGGVFRLLGAGKISFWDTSSSLVINNTTYTLINSLPALIAAIASNPSGTYAFANDYNAAQDGSYPQSPIPTTFTGIFEGLGSTINNLTIYNSKELNTQVALFSGVGAGGQISDINLVDFSIKVYSAYVAPLAGINDGTIVHASASGALAPVVGANWGSAGLVWDNRGTVTRSRAAVNMTGSQTTGGGLIGYNSGTISLSDASGSVIGEFAGGLVAVSTGTITDSYAQGDVTVGSNALAQGGGLVGSFAGTILRCFATGNVLGTQSYQGNPKKFGPAVSRLSRRKNLGLDLGGLVGASRGSIQYAYSMGSVSGDVELDTKPSHIGGLVGLASQESMAQVYSLGAVSLNERHYLGGVIGYDDMPRENDAAFWDLDTSGIRNPDQGAGNVFDDVGLKGLSSKQFQHGAAMRHFDPAVWGQSASINNGYPYLLANPPPQ